MNLDVAMVDPVFVFIYKDGVMKLFEVDRPDFNGACLFWRYFTLSCDVFEDFGKFFRRELKAFLVSSSYKIILVNGAIILWVHKLVESFN